MSINIDLEFKNYDKWASKLKNLTKEFEKAIDDGMIEFIDRFQDKLRENAQLYGINDPYILGTMLVTPYKNGYVLTIRSEQIAYVEYGVGIVGSQNKHPKSPSGWIYDINNHGNSGWVYPVITDTDYSYNDKQFYTKDGNILAWTKGHKPKPFVYQTWLWGTRAMRPIIEKHLRRIKID